MFRSILALAIVLIFLILGIPIMLFLCILRLFNKVLSEKIAHYIVSFIFKLIISSLAVKVKVTGLDNLLDDTPVLYASNHLSIFDVVFSYPYIKEPCGYISKKELLKIPLLNVWMHLIECLFIDRKNIKNGLMTINKAINKIKNNISIFVFPEGTRSRDGKLKDFKAGSFKIAIRTCSPIIPLSIQGTNKILQKGLFVNKNITVHINFGAPIYVKDLSREDKKHIDKIVRDKILSLTSLTSIS